MPKKLGYLETHKSKAQYVTAKTRTFKAAIGKMRPTVSFQKLETKLYEGWNFNSGNYLFTTDTK